MRVQLRMELCPSWGNDFYPRWHLGRGSCLISLTLKDTESTISCDIRLACIAERLCVKCFCLCTSKVLGLVEIGVSFQSEGPVCCRGAFWMICYYNDDTNRVSNRFKFFNWSYLTSFPIIHIKNDLYQVIQLTKLARVYCTIGIVPPSTKFFFLQVGTDNKYSVFTCPPGGGVGKSWIFFSFHIRLFSYLWSSLFEFQAIQTVS